MDLNTYKRITQNIERLKYFYQYKFYFFSDIENIIHENIDCILLELNNASICMTNHLMERMLKHSLIHYNLKYHIGDPKFEEELQIHHNKFDDKYLNEIIDSAKKQKIITKEQADKLHKFRTEYRNPFSHAQIGKIVKQPFANFTGMIGQWNQPEQEFQKIQAPRVILAQSIQDTRSQQESLSYFKDIFEIMVSIEEKFRNKSNNQDP